MIFLAMSVTKKLDHYTSKAAETATQAAQDCRDTLNQFTLDAENATQHIINIKKEALNDIANSRKDTLETIDAARIAAVKELTDNKNSALSLLNVKYNDYSSALYSAGTAILHSIESTRYKSVDSVYNAKDRALSAIKQQEGLSVQAVKDAQRLTTAYLQGYVNNAKQETKNANAAAESARKDADTVKSIADKIQNTSISPWKVIDGKMCIVVKERKEQIYV